MGKPPRPKKKESTDTAGEKDPDTAIKDGTNVSDTFEERLRRMELSQSQSSSDVYKFVFFFVMGIVLTIIVYPGVSNILQSSKLSEDKVNVIHRATDHADVEEVTDKWRNDDTEMVKDEQHHVGSDENKTKAKLETMKTEDLMMDEVGVENSIDTTEDTYIQIDEPEDVSEPPRDTDSTDKRAGEPLKLTPVSPDSDTLAVELNPEHIQMVHEQTTADTRTKHDEKERKPVTKNKSTKTKSSAKSNKENKKDKNKSKKVSSKTDTKNDVKDSNVKQKEMPKEIKDFKATYQRTTDPKKIFADGRRIPPMELLPQKSNNSSVKVWLFDEFLSEQECDGLMRVHNQHVKDQSKDDPILCFDTIATLRKHLQNAKKNIQVTPRDFTDGTTCVNSSFSSQLKDWFKGNWSYSTAFYPGESRFANVFENRIEQAMGLKPANGGKFQITSYPLGIGYKSHTDCMEDSSDQRDRMATVLVYLDTVDEGGETDFPELGIWARPRKGRALMWNNMDENGKCEPMSIHQAKQVVKGHKYIIQRWYYYKSFYSLGKRPPEPPLPVRSPAQPRVSCDEYEHGSCRWYDEWNFEHLIEYEKQKYTLV